MDPRRYGALRAVADIGEAMPAAVDSLLVEREVLPASDIGQTIALLAALEADGLVQTVLRDADDTGGGRAPVRGHIAITDAGSQALTAGS